ncbi:MAG: cardiolipin synthase [Clostridia bacterium]|nr:cardiolipin synthase [Clostridia bacterium]
MSKFFKILFRRSTILATLFILQFIVFILVGTYLIEYSIYINAVFYTISIIMAVYILALRSGTIDIKLPWIVLIFAFPVFGTLAYSMFNQDNLRKKIIKNLESQACKPEDFATPDPIINDRLLQENKRMFQQANYMYTSNNLPPFINSPTKYFKIGEEYYKELLKQLKTAEKFIFIESFIINEGKMWNSILDILNEKIKQNVEVRVIYDDWGNITKLPDHYNKQLEKLGIKCVIFNPITPFLSLRHNNRDHKKIIIIDGKVAFTGGINLADEYINEKLRFGHWKDSGIMVQGDAVRSFTFMFLETWHCYRDKHEDCQKYISEGKTHSDGFVQPYLDSPADNELVARNIYINILNDATDYVYITTPYLILDPELTNSIVSASKRGVNIKIITPHIPDKWYVHLMTQSHYLSLTKVGVEIYEYTPGFIHAKNVICDDIVATVGTVNFDYRSLYHNYECGIWMYKTSTIQEIKKDFNETINKSTQITIEKLEKVNILKVMLSSMLKFFSPLF